jgi:hypothetical protein
MIVGINLSSSLMIITCTYDTIINEEKRGKNRRREKKP